MILPFSTQLNGKPTYFVEKIWKGLKECISPELQIKFEQNMTKDEMEKTYQIDGEIYVFSNPKIHTIREDMNNRWKAGVIIDFFINTRTKNMFRFAPRISVVSTQKINIFWIQDQKGNLTHSTLVPKRYNWVDVIIDGFILEVEQIKELAQNDGFDTVEEFFAYFNHDFSGKIIHWTDKKY
jgi:hypothetical protein